MNDVLRRIGPGLFLAFVVLVLAVLGVTVVVAEQAGAAYASAPSCTLATADPNNCYIDRQARITSVSYIPIQSTTGRLLGSYTIGLGTGDGNWTAQVGRSQLLRPPVVGETVTIRIWHHVVTLITVNGISATTYLTPPTPPLANWWLVFIGIVGIGLLLALGIPAWNWLARRRAPAPRRRTRRA